MAGDSIQHDSAFTQLVAEQHQQLRGFVRTLGVDPEWVDDLAQEVFLVAWRESEAFDSQRDIGKWLRGRAGRYGDGWKAPDLAERLWAADAMGMVLHPATADALVEALNDEDLMVCALAYRALEGLGAPGLAHLESALKDLG